MPLGVDPKVDYAFKKLFGSPDTKDLLTHVLNAVLQLPAGSEVIDPVVMNPFNEKQSATDKPSVLDIKARDAQGRIHHIEMQMEAWWTFPPRVLYYWSRSHGQQLVEGAPFADLKPTISVCFIGNQLYREVAGHHHSFKLLDPRSGLVFTEHISIHVVELGKFALVPSDLKTPLDLWCYFLRHGATLDGASLPASLDVPIIRRAMEALTVMTQNEIEREQYESRFRAQLEERSREWDRQETQRQADDARRQLEESERQADDARRQLEELERQADDARRQLEESERQADDARRQLEETQRQADDARRQLEETQRQADDARRQADDARRQADLARAEAIIRDVTARVHLAQRLLKMPETPKDDLLRLTPEERAALADRLEHEVATRMAGGPSGASGQPLTAPAP